MTNNNNDGRPFATRNHYYVAVTRAKNDIYILCDNRPNVLNFFNVENNIPVETISQPTLNDDDDDLPF
jgi:superfamily I DNA/RNA helicase